MWLSEQTANISLNSINFMVFITEAQCVYWAGRTEYLNKFWLKFFFKGITSQNIFEEKGIRSTLKK
jgi:hypothetical protein